jgi:hypothetical protein
MAEDELVQPITHEHWDFDNLPEKAKEELHFMKQNELWSAAMKSKVEC